jgi:Lipid A 3-O-deacylase (PagL)/OmpA-like transmembrane domain
MKFRRLLIRTAVVWCSIGLSPASAQTASSPAPEREDSRAQYPRFLADSYFSVNLGYIDYEFSERQLEAGFRAGSIGVPHVAVAVALFGHDFNEHLSAQFTYMRPVQYVTYRNINGAESAHHVWMHFGGLSLKGRVPITPRVSIYGEGGLGLTSRHGFETDGGVVVASATYASVLAGGGIEYRVNRAWDLTAGVTYLPGRARDNQAGTALAMAGFRYTMRQLPPDRIEASRRSGFIFPENLLQIEFSTGVGYGVNTFVSKRVPVFWGGNVKVDRGIAAHYQRNVFHTKKVFALDLGASVSVFRSQGNREEFYTLSAYPLLRFTLIRTKPVDFYVCYSLAGPTYISRVVIDDADTGRHFTFQDFMGMGVFVGAKRNLSLGVKINHYSNGNIFTKNAGLKIPLTFELGYAF